MTVDGRVYIGCTRQTLAQRIGQHKCEKKEFMIIPHTVDILQQVETQDQGEILEAYYIEKFDSCNPEKGWNRRLGSNKWGFPEWVQAGFGKAHSASHIGPDNGMYGRIQSSETREKIRLKALGRVSPLKGKKLPDEVRLRKNAVRGDKGFLRGEDHPLFGKSHSEETKAKIAEASKGNTKWLGRKHSEESKAKMSATKQAKRLSS